MKNIVINKETTLKEAMEKLSETGDKTIVIIDSKNKLLGTLSDGDLRKAILKGININSSVKNIYNKTPTFLIKGEYSTSSARDIFLKSGFDLIPIVDHANEVVDVLFWRKIFKNEKIIDPQKNLEIPVIIMAGGRGTRLEPFTKVLPKPLVPIHEKPIIEHIIERFTTSGCKQFYLTVNYKSRILKAFFEELQPKYNVDFIEENEPLGTAGSLKFLSDKINSTFIVTNCDIIINMNYVDIYDFHKKNKFDITIVASMKNHVIPYGTCEVDNNGLLKNIIEKPEFDFLINTGFYILENKMIELVPSKKLYHMTDLITDAKKQKFKIGLFPIREETWIDIGQWSEYHKAIDQL
tara:strand:- start:19472 stop:20524 length:1053 start_codon:yes stop_codon:yes gene_type:complete